MSAAAYITTNKGTVLISDGIGYNETGIVTESARKVFELTPSTGFIWLGARLDAAEGAINDYADGKDAESAIRAIAGLWQRTVLQMSEEEQAALTKSPYCMYAFGYKLGEAGYWRLHYNEDRFTPVYKPMAAGQCGAMVDSIKNPNQQWRDLIKRELSKYRRKSLKNYQKATRAAFTKLVRTYKRRTERIGGQTFMITITPEPST